MTFYGVSLSRAFFFAVVVGSLVGLPLIAGAQERLTAPAQGKATATRAATPAPAIDTNAKPIPKRAPTPGQVAMRQRRVECGAEWRKSKAQGAVEEGITWPKFWSACNKRLKESRA
jgi:hypothetical protein